MYGFVERSGGAIQVYSEPDRGTQLALYFPRHKESHLPEQHEMAQNVYKIKGTESILVVDDELALLAISREILEANGYTVFVAENGRQALDALGRESIDLILSDVIMPEMDGYQLAAIVQREYPDVKIQLASGFTYEHDADLVDNDLHIRMLHKPYNSQDLLLRIRELLDGKSYSMYGDGTKETSKAINIQPLEWNERFSVGIEELDKDHKFIILLINRCIRVTDKSNRNNELGEILKELVEYTKYHFRREELVMEVCGYPNTLKHRKVHQMLIQKLGERFREHELGNLVAESLYEFLVDWLENHIMVMDRAISPYSAGKDDRIKKALESQ